MGKQLKSMFAAMCFVFALAMAISVQIKAADASKLPTPKKDDLGIHEFDFKTNKTQFEFAFPKEADTVRFQMLVDGKKSVDAIYQTPTDAERMYTKDGYRLKLNKVYKYRIKYMKGNAAGAWSPYRYILLPKYTAKSYSNKKGFTIKTPKNKNIKKYVISVAKGQDQPIKKTAEIKANKKRTTKITKNYKKNGVTYFEVCSYVKDGKKTYKSDIVLASVIKTPK